MLELSKFGTVSIKQLKRAIHVADKVTYITSEVDREALSCATLCTKTETKTYCSSCEECQNCEHLELKEVKTTVYEKHKYGQAFNLRKNALLTYIALHLLQPDSHGTVYVDIDDFADILNCDPATIVNNLTILSRGKFIGFGSGRYEREKVVMIFDYRNNFLKYSDGGQGYIAFTDELFNLLKEESNLNTIRFVLQLYIKEYTNINKKLNLYSLKAQFMKWMPAYCRPSAVLEALSSKLFKTIFNLGVKGRHKYKNAYIVEIKEAFTSRFINSAHDVNTEEQIREYVQELVNDTKEDKKLELSEKEYQDISKIGRQYGIRYIKQAIYELYHIIDESTVSNLKCIPAVVRRYTQQCALIA